MQDIKELVHLFVEYHLSHPDLPKLRFKKGGKLGAFFSGLANGKIETDEDALWHLYQTREGNSTYRKLKSSLRELLLESLCDLNTDSKEFTDFQKAYFDCHKKWVYIKILIGRNANTAAISLAVSLLKQTSKYDFVHLSLDIVSYLRLQFALRESNDKKFQEANRQFVYFRNVRDAECLAEELYALFTVSSSNTNKTVSVSPKNELNSQIEQLSLLLQKIDSYRLHLYGRLLRLKWYSSTGDFNRTLVECEEAIRFFLSKPYDTRGALQIFYYEKLNSHIELRQKQAGQETADKIGKYLISGTFNWFKAQELLVKLCMHTEAYKSASAIILKVIQHKRYQFLPENVKEIWRVYKAYLYFLALAHKVNLPQNFGFRVGKFLNTTPILSKDKLGMNVAIKVAQVLVLIAERKYSQLLEETESLEQYAYRYLKKGAAQRSFLFVKMLLQIPMGQFDAGIVEKRTRKYLDKLNQMPTIRGNQYVDIEVIPYEHLWPMAVSLLAR